MSGKGNSPRSSYLFILWSITMLLLCWPAMEGVASERVFDTALGATAGIAPLHNTAVVSLDGMAAESPVVVETSFQQQQPVTLTKKADQDAYCPGTLITYTITLASKCDGDADHGEAPWGGSTSSVRPST